MNKKEKLIACDLFKTEYYENGVELIYSDIARYAMKEIHKETVSYQEYIDFLNSEVALILKFEYKRELNNINTEHQKSGVKLIFKGHSIKFSKRGFLQFLTIELNKITSLVNRPD